MENAGDSPSQVVTLSPTLPAASSPRAPEKPALPLPKDPHARRLRFSSGKPSIQHRIGHRDGHVITFTVLGTHSNPLLAPHVVPFGVAVALLGGKHEPHFRDGETEVEQDGARSLLFVLELTLLPSPLTLYLGPPSVRASNWAWPMGGTRKTLKEEREKLGYFSL